MTIAIQTNKNIRFEKYSYETSYILIKEKLSWVCTYTNYPHKQETQDEYLERINNIKQNKVICIKK